MRELKANWVPIIRGKEKQRECLLNLEYLAAIECNKYIFPQ